MAEKTTYRNRNAATLALGVNVYQVGGGYNLLATFAPEDNTLAETSSFTRADGPNSLRAHRRFNGARRSRCFILAQRRRGAERREKGEVSSIQYPVSSIQCLMGNAGIGLGGTCPRPKTINFQQSTLIQKREKE